MGFLLQVDVEAFRESFVPAIQSSLQYFGAEFQVVIAAMAILLLDLFLPRRYSPHLAWVALAACLIPLSSIGYHAEASRSLFLGMTAIDPFASFFKGFFLLGSAVIVVLSYVSRPLADRRMGEYYFLVLASAFGAMLMASATHFLTIFLSIELLSLCSYVLVGYVRGARAGVEASLKYFIYGSVAAAVMAYGFSLWYGLTGSADIASLARLVWNPEDPVLTERATHLRTVIVATVALVMILLGLSYKMSTVPMHFWAPDVYEGAPTPITAYLSVVSKAAGFAVAIRFFHALAGSTAGLVPGEAAATVWSFLDWHLLLIVLAILTMTFGNLAALWQTNLKRLLAYSSIAHAGYLMMGLTLLGRATEYGGEQTIAFYLLAYLAMNFGAFAVVQLVENRVGSAELSGFRGLGRRAPFLALSLTVFLFSLIGVPPTAGFVGKFHLLMGVVDVQESAYYVLAVVAVLNTVVSAYYYLRIAKAMYFEESTDAAVRAPLLGHAVVAGMVLLTLYLFLRADEILKTTLDLELHL